MDIIALNTMDSKERAFYEELIKEVDKHISECEQALQALQKRKTRYVNSLQNLSYLIPQKIVTSSDMLEVMKAESEKVFSNVELQTILIKKGFTEVNLGKINGFAGALKASEDITIVEQARWKINPNKKAPLE